MTQQFHPGYLFGKKQTKKKRIQKDTCTLMFTAALFTIAKTWKQSKCPSTDEWIKKIWCIYTMEYHSVIKKEWNFAICSNMDGLGGHYDKWNKSDRERQILYDITYMWNLENTTNQWIKQKRSWLTHKEQTSGYQWGEGRGRSNIGSLGLTYTHYYI